MHSTIGISCILPADLRVTLGALRLSPRRSRANGMESDGDGHQSAECRNVDVFDELCESTNGNISAYFMVYVNVNYLRLEVQFR